MAWLTPGFKLGNRNLQAVKPDPAKARPQDDQNGPEKSNPRGLQTRPNMQ